MDPVQLKHIEGAALFYPCCGSDFDTPLKLFASAVEAFYFVDVHRPRRLAAPLPGLERIPRRRSTAGQRFRHQESGNEFDLYQWQCRGEEAFEEVQKIGVFFHRGDTLANGEGSSGVPWLGRDWLTRILSKLVPHGFLVTDGSNLPPDGPPQLGLFHGNRTIGPEAVTNAQSFEFAGRILSCVWYAGERYGPTLVWQAAERGHNDRTSPDNRSRYGA
jgi:hypothetical protein